MFRPHANRSADFVVGNFSLALSSADVFDQILPYLLSLISMLSFLTNAPVLLAFIGNRQLRTYFNIYLANLVVANLGQSLLDLPFTVVTQVSKIWTLGRLACSVNLYAKWVFVGVVRNTHALISVNRLWATFSPLTYRRHHTKKTAVLMIIGTWIYVHIFLLPGLIPDFLYNRLDDGTCAINTTANRHWAIPTQLVLYDGTVVIIFGTYPFIWWNMSKRRKTVPTKTTVQRDHLTYNTTAAGSTPPVTRKTIRLRIIEMEQLSNPTATTKISLQNFRIVTYLTLAVVFCWSPIMIFFTIQIIDTTYDNYYFFIMGSLLYYMNTILDPIFFTAAIAPLRATVYSLVNCACRRKR